MERAPAAQRAAPAPPSATPGHRWEDSYPIGGLALQRWARDVDSAPTGQPKSPVNQDAVWFAANELRGFAPAEGVVGASCAVDPQLVARLARFAFVDNVRGQTLPFSSKALTVASMHSVVAAVDGDVRTLHFSGQTAATTDGTDPGEAYWRSARAWPRSLAVNLAGEARWDAAARGSRRSSWSPSGHAADARRSTAGRRRARQRARHWLLASNRAFRSSVAPTYVNLYGRPGSRCRSDRGAAVVPNAVRRGDQLLRDPRLM